MTTSTLLISLYRDGSSTLYLQTGPSVRYFDACTDTDGLIDRHSPGRRVKIRLYCCPHARIDRPCDRSC